VRGRLARRRAEDDPEALEKLRFELLASGLFDPDFYLDRYPDVAATGADPVAHYLRLGWREGREPSPRFDAALYVESYPDVAEARANPLVHYLRYGRAEGRIARPLPRPAPPPAAPTADAWERLAAALSARPAGAPAVDIVVPVHSGFHATASCLHSVLRSRIGADVACAVVVVDDRGPEPEIGRLADELAARGLVTLLRNERNRGFVASVNRGMALHPDRDVVLLNSDTEVYGDWVERLRRAAYSDPWAGTVTPLSNNATICSYPYLARDFRGAFEIGFEELDRLAREANAGATAEIPTAVGFCMYIRRDCLAEAGAFDERAFGAGYGEENDFCRRIAARGFRNLLAGEVFVRHLGRTSFGASTDARIAAALDLLRQRYPRYLAEVDDFLAEDPPKTMRRRLDAARLKRGNGERSVVFCLHGLEGGTVTHVRELVRLLAREGVGALLLRPAADDPRFAELSRFDVEHLSTACRIDLRHGLAAAAELLGEAGAAHLHVHHLLGFAPDAIDFFPALAGRLGVAYDFTAHDHLAACPRLEMIDGSGVFCGNRDVEICEACVAKLGSRAGDVGVRAWRAAYARFLAGARRIFVPHEDVRARLRDFFPEIDFAVRPHPEPVPDRLRPPVARRPGEALRVAVVGAIGPPKGSRQLLRCAEDAARRRLPIEYVVVGFADLYELNTLGNVRVTGKYAERDLPRLLEREACHLAFFPSVWPETYCYTLSQAFFAGLFPVAFDLGALAARIRAAGWGLVLPWQFVHDPGRVNDTLLATDPTPPPPDFRPVAGERLYPSLLADYYGLSRAELGL
jgi:GT2 family glycosyltransferase